MDSMSRRCIDAGQLLRGDDKVICLVGRERSNGEAVASVTVAADVERVMVVPAAAAVAGAV
eukprot:3105645-Pleurochrysis_carterae.AAC.1